MLTICISVYKIYQNSFFKESFSQYRCRLSPFKVRKYKSNINVSMYEHTLLYCIASIENLTHRIVYSHGACGSVRVEQFTSVKFLHCCVRSSNKSGYWHSAPYFPKAVAEDILGTPCLGADEQL